MTPRKIAVVNRTNLINYGSVLQVLALCEAVKSLGYEAEVIWEAGSVAAHFDFRPRKMISTVWKLLTHPKLLKNTLNDVKDVQGQTVPQETSDAFSAFVDSHINRRFLSPKQMRAAGRSGEYHRFVCGSDQVWCTTTLYPDPLMYLRFTTKEKRVAYAPSLGRDYIPDYNRRILKKYISDFPCVSIRESKGAELICGLTGMKAPVVLDPTLLFDKSFWKQYAGQNNEKDYILCYFLDAPTAQTQTYIKEFAGNKKIVVLRSPLEGLSGLENVITPLCGPEVFLGYLMNADYVFTDSYHGMIFSINIHRDFCAIERNYQTFDQSSRQKSILHQLGLESRYVTNIEDRDMMPIDYQPADEKLAQLRKESFTYLEGALR